MNARFLINDLKTEGLKAFVIARQISDQNELASDFAVSKSTLLGGCRLAPELYESRPGLFTFLLEDSSDALKFSRGTLVELTES